MKTAKKVTRGSGNVFADLGLADADEHMLKARVVMLIGAAIEQRKLSQTAAAKIMGLKQPDLSKLLRGRFEGFSLVRLLSFARALGSDVEIKVKPPRDKHEGRLSLKVA